MEIKTRRVSGALKLKNKQTKKQNPFFKRILLGNLICKKGKDGIAIYEEGWGSGTLVPWYLV